MILILSFSVANSFSIKYLKSLKISFIFNNNLHVKVSWSEIYSKKLGKTLRKIILKEINKDCEKPLINSGDQIVDYDLALYDTESPNLIGLNKEFLASGRLDNLGSSIPALYSMINASKDELLEEQTSINIIALFDNEEIGSMTYQGADSNFFLMHLKRIFSQSLNITKTSYSEDLYLRFMAKSYVISADLAHAFNPNYPEKFQGQHLNKLQKGIVLKINVNGKYYNTT